MNKLLCVCFLLVSLPSIPSKAQSIDESLKRAIVRIETPDGHLGTGFILSDTTLGYFLVTNKHVIQNGEDGHYHDSIFVRQNRLSPSGKVVAASDKFVLHLHYKGKSLFALHPDPNIDIVLISMAENVDFPRDSTFLISLRISTLASRENVKQLNITDGTHVQLVGFSFQIAQQQDQFHMSRFGQIGLFSDQRFTLQIGWPRGDKLFPRPMTSEWLIIDAVSRPGDSGGPVFAWFSGQKQPWLIGIMLASSAEEQYCIAQPSFYILDLVKMIKPAH